MEPISVCSLLHRVVFVVSWLGLSTGALAENFSTDFEGLPDVNPNAGTFTEFAGTLSVRFEGGTRFTAGIGDLYRNGSRKSWMIDPAPINDSTGMGTATLSEGATEVTFYGKIQSDSVVATYRVLDELGGVLEQGDLNDDNNWQAVNVTAPAGMPLITTVEVLNTSASGANLMVGIEDFSFSTDVAGVGGGSGDGDDSESTSVGPLALILLSLGWVMARGTRRR